MSSDRKNYNGRKGDSWYDTRGPMVPDDGPDQSQEALIEAGN